MPGQDGRECGQWTSKQLKALVTVAEVGSVTRAAELLHLVQPAVTRQIRPLEQEVGVALFERTRQGMRPTEAGAMMVDRARRALNELERARVEVQPTPGVVTLRSLIDGAAGRAAVEMDIVVQTNSMRLQKQLVRVGHGWTILPGVGIAEDVADGTLNAAPLCDPDVWRSIVLATPRNGRTPPAAEVVARELVRHIASAVQQGRWPSAQPHAQFTRTDDI